MVSPHRILAAPALFRPNAINPNMLKANFKAASVASKQKVLHATPSTPVPVIAARAESPAHPLPNFENTQEAEAARDAFLAAVSRAMFENVMFERAAFDNAPLENGTSEAGQLAEGPASAPRLPTVLMIRTAEFVQSDAGSSPGSQSTIWKIQVWRVMVVDPSWWHKAITPAAHTT